MGAHPAGGGPASSSVDLMVSTDAGITLFGVSGPAQSSLVGSQQGVEACPALKHEN